MERLQDMFFLLVLRLKTGVSGTISFRPSLGTAICKRTLPWTCHDISLYFSVLSTADAPMTASQRMVLGQIDGFCNGLVKVSRMHTIMSIQKKSWIDWNLTRINRTFLGQINRTFSRCWVKSLWPHVVTEPWNHPPMANLFRFMWVKLAAICTKPQENRNVYKRYT